MKTPQTQPRMDLFQLNTSHQKNRRPQKRPLVSTLVSQLPKCPKTARNKLKKRPLVSMLSPTMPVITKNVQLHRQVNKNAFELK